MFYRYVMKNMEILYGIKYILFFYAMHLQEVGVHGYPENRHDYQLYYMRINTTFYSKGVSADFYISWYSKFPLSYTECCPMLENPVSSTI